MDDELDLSSSSAQDNDSDSDFEDPSTKKKGSGSGSAPKETCVVSKNVQGLPAGWTMRTVTPAKGRKKTEYIAPDGESFSTKKAALASARTKKTA